MHGSQSKHSTDETRKMLHLFDLAIASLLTHKHVPIDLADVEKVLQHPIDTLVVQLLQSLSVKNWTNFHLFSFASLDPGFEEILIETIAKCSDTVIAAFGFVFYSIDLLLKTS